MTQRDPNGISQHAPGAKLDAGKTPIVKGLLAQFPHACTEVAEISAYGAPKYPWGGWRSVPDANTRYLDALGRHLIMYLCGEDLDRESQRMHLAHMAWNALAVLELSLTEIEEAYIPATAPDKIVTQLDDSWEIVKATEFHNE
jgi:hypothetical protein